jgi:hypothetical protein
MCSLMTHGEGGGKRPTLTKHKMSACAQASKRVPVQKIVKCFEMAKFDFGGKCKVGLLAKFWFLL